MSCTHVLVCFGNSTACWEFRPERRCHHEGDDVGSDSSYAWTGVCVCGVYSFKILVLNDHTVGLLK